MILLIRSLLCVYYKYPIINLIILREGDTVNIHLRIGSSIRKEQLLMRKKEQMDYQIKGSQKVIETDSSNTNLGERSRAIRAKLGLSQSDVAKELNVTRGFISNVENGRVSMSLRLMIYYAKIMHCTLDEVAGLMNVSYRGTSLDNAIMAELSKMDKPGKEALLKELREKNSQK